MIFRWSQNAHTSLLAIGKVLATVWGRGRCRAGPTRIYTSNANNYIKDVAAGKRDVVPGYWVSYRDKLWKRKIPSAAESNY